jgi:hypothetical protein
MPSALAALQLGKRTMTAGVAVILIHEKEKMDGNSIGRPD